MEATLNEEIECARADLNDIQKGHPDRATLLRKLAALLASRFESLPPNERAFSVREENNDINEAIDCGREALHSLPAAAGPDRGHETRAECVSELVKYLTCRFEAKEDGSDLEEAIQLLRDFIDDLPKDYPGRDQYLDKLGSVLASMAEHMESMSDSETSTWESTSSAYSESDESDAELLRFQIYIDEAVQVAQEALDAVPPEETSRRVKYTSNLADLLARRYTLLDGLSDLERAIELERDILTKKPRDDMSRAASLNKLADRLATFGSHKAELDQEMNAAAPAREALAAGPLTIAILDESISLAQEAVDIQSKFDSGSALRSKYLMGLADSYWDRYHATKAARDLDRAVEIGRETVRSAVSADPHRPEYHHYLCDYLEMRHRDNLRKGSANPDDLEEAISMAREALQDTGWSPPSQLDQYMRYQDTLSKLLLLRYKSTMARAGFKQAVMEYIDGTPWHIKRLQRQRSIGCNINSDRDPDLDSADRENDSVGEADAREEARRRSEDTEDEELQKLAREAKEMSESTPPTHPGRAIWLNKLATCLKNGYDGFLDDLDKGVELMREAVRITPEGHPERPEYLNNLATVLVARYKAMYGTDDSEEESEDADGSSESAEGQVDSEVEEEGVTSNTDAKDDMDRDSEAGSDWFEDSEKSSESSPDDGDLDEAINLVRDAIGLVSSKDSRRPVYIASLMHFLAYRNESADLREATNLLGMMAEEIPRDDPNRANGLERLSEHLDPLWDATEDLDGIDDIIRAQRNIVDAIPEDHPSRAHFLSLLAGSVLNRFDFFGQRDDVELAVRLARDAVDALPEGHQKEAEYRRKLSVAIMRRYAMVQIDTDLEDSIRLAREALGLSKGSKIEYLETLAKHLFAKFREHSDMRDWDEAASLLRVALQEAPLNSEAYSSLLYELAWLLRARFMRKRIAADVEIAVRIQRHLVDRNKDADNLAKASDLTSLATFLTFKYRGAGGSNADMQEAFRLQKEAIRLTPKDFPERVTMFYNLSLDYEEKYRRTKDEKDEQSATYYFTRGLNVENGPPLGRIMAGRSAFRNHVLAKDWQGARAVAETIVSLLPRLSISSLTRDQQQETLGELSSFSSEAASVVLQDGGSASEAFQTLEAGRGIIASFIMDSQSDISLLKDLDPPLYAEYVLLRDRVSQSAEPGKKSHNEADRASLPGPSNRRLQSEVSEYITQRYKDISRLRDLEKRIRRVKGLSRFLLPPTTEGVQSQADHGPIVAFNATEYRSDAFIITRGNPIRSIPLPAIEFEELESNVEKLAGEDKLSVGPPSTKKSRQNELQRILKWLWDVAVRPVLRNLGFLTKTPSHPLPRVWWITNGYLGLMPLHAAGGKKTTSDYVVSSYISSIKGLSYARQRDLDALLGKDTRMLVVEMPRTVGLPSLDTTREIKSIRDNVKALPNITPRILTERPKTEVMSELVHSQIIHFACHGISDSMDPSAGSLFLGEYKNDEPDTLTIRELARIRHQLPQIAYLSACSTAEITDTSLTNEAIHIASAFQLLGFPHVIGTLWEADNNCATEVAGSFYQALVEQLQASGRKVTHDIVAYAMHHAVQTLRSKKPGNYIGWVPFVHIGA
ncbi:CHAT domain-containing protein [Aspergillus recurvatus]